MAERCLVLTPSGPTPVTAIERSNKGKLLRHKVSEAFALKLRSRLPFFSIQGPFCCQEETNELSEYEIDLNVKISAPSKCTAVVSYGDHGRED